MNASAAREILSLLRAKQDRRIAGLTPISELDGRHYRILSKLATTLFFMKHLSPAKAGLESFEDLIPGQRLVRSLARG